MTTPDHSRAGLRSFSARGFIGVFTRSSVNVLKRTCGSRTKITHKSPAGGGCKPALSGLRVLYYLLAFFFILLSVDGVMATLAIRTQTGIVTEHPYEKGLAYNKVVQDADRQQALGWKGEITFKAEGKNKGILRFTLADHTGKILLPDTVQAAISRPIQAGMDFTLPLHQGMNTINFPAKGLWEIRIYATYKNQVYQQSKRIIVDE